MKLVYPLKRTEYVTQSFGANPQYYSQFKIGGVPLKGHEGLDLRAEDSTEVVATDEGTIAEAFDQGNVGYGRYIKIIHSWGESVYAHLKEFKVKATDKVGKGQTIALSDNTGNSSAAHLHFGIRINPYNKSDGWGGYSDPAPYFNEEVVEVITDQTKIPQILDDAGSPMEVQAIRSTIGDQKNTIESLRTEVKKLQDRVTELENAPVSPPSTPESQIEAKPTNFIASIFYSLYKAFNKEG